MRQRLIGLSVLLLAGRVTTAFAQAPTPVVEPATQAGVQIGPFSMRPTVILRDVGFDSNVFNEPADPRGDFTATIGAKLDVSARLTRIQGTYSSFYEYLYFKTYDSERGSNRGAEGRVDVLLGRLRPYIAAGITNSHDRPTSEIDARAHRQQGNVGLGVTALAFSHTAVSVGYRHSGVDYAADEQFRGVNLADELNGHSDSITLGGDIELSSLTAVSVIGERVRDRFEFSPERDADSFRLGVTATLQPLALISGRATVGVRAFRPQSSLLREFTGLTAAIAVGYSFLSDTRISVAFDRDLRYSFEQLTPYYISTAGRVAVTKRMIGNLDGQVFAGAERIAYEARLDAPAISNRDSVRTYGAGIGYRVRDGGRLALNFDQTKRSSTANDREYSRGRIYTTLTYGF
jgi:hypothetical protein